MSLFEELKRRRVFRLIAAYVVVTWVIVQVVTAIEEPLNLPDWFDTVVIVLLGVGFPIAVIMSWVYDVTPEGVVRDDDAEARPVRIDYGKIALIFVLILGAFLVGNYVRQPSTITADVASGLQTFEIGIPVNADYSQNEPRPVALTPDGRSIVLYANIGGRGQLFRRNLQSLDVLPIDGTEGVNKFFDISPNGTTIVFQSNDDGLIKKVSIEGGIPTALADPDGFARFFDWGDTGQITFVTRPKLGVLQIPDTGGPVSMLVDDDEVPLLTHPSFIPGTEWMTVTVSEATGGLSANDEDRVALLSPAGEIHEFDMVGSSARVSPEGSLVYYNRNALWRVGFDLSDLVITGESVALVDDVFYSRVAHFDFSEDGSLIYKRDSTRGKNSLIWVDREGNEHPISLQSGRYSHPHVSPDGRLLAVTNDSPYGSDIWIYSFERGELTQRTFDQSRETVKVWDLAMQYLYFESGQDMNAFRLHLVGEPEVVQLTDSPVGLYPSTITPDGRTLIIDEWEGLDGDGNNIAAMNIDVSTDLEYLMKSDFRESHPRLSPDGSILAYMSNLGGPLEVYIRRFPITDDEVVQVSTGGNSWQPQWNGDGTELFYRDIDDGGVMYVVPVDTTDGIRVGRPRALFGTESYQFDGAGSHDYDSARDRFVMIKKPPPGSAQDEIVLIQNWRELLPDQPR